MSGINKLLNALKDNEYIKSFKPSEEDIVDFLGGSTRAASDLLGGSNNEALIASGFTAASPLGRILTKPGRMGADFAELLIDPKWSLKNNKIGLTKDALILNYLFGDDEKETDIDEELDNYE